jgi:hypothetical protein
VVTGAGSATCSEFECDGLSTLFAAVHVALAQQHTTCAANSEQQVDEGRSPLAGP